MPASWAIAATRSRSTTMPPGLARFSRKMAFVRGVSAFRKFSGSVGSTKWHFQPSFLERQPELGQRAAIEIARGDELVSCLQQGEEDQELCGMPRGCCDCGAAAFEARDPLFQDSNRRIIQARIDVAEIVQVEERGRVVDVLENI